MLTGANEKPQPFQRNRSDSCISGKKSLSGMTVTEEIYVPRYFVRATFLGKHRQVLCSRELLESKEGDMASVREFGDPKRIKEEEIKSSCDIHIH